MAYELRIGDWSSDVCSSDLDVAGGAEELLGRVERPGVDATRHDPTRGGRREVVGAGEAGDAVEDDDDVVAVLDEALGPLDRQLGDLGVLLAGAVERRADHRGALALEPALHVGDLLRALVDEQHEEVDLGVVALDRPGDLLHDRGLARLRRRHDQAALALTDRRSEEHTSDLQSLMRISSAVFCLNKKIIPYTTTYT